MSDLRGRVQITSPKEALSFVRLATTPITCFMVQRRKEADSVELEVMDRDQDVPALSYGLRWLALKPSLEQWRNFPEGRYGLISASVAKQLGIGFAKVSASKTGFAVERTLLVRRANYLVKTREWVGQDGEYRIDKNEKIVLPGKPAIAWEWPQFDIM